MNFITSDQALAGLRSGQRVYIHNGCAEPLELVRALSRRGGLLNDVEILHMATMGPADYTLPEFEGRYRHNALFIGGNVRQAVQEGRADYTPIFLSEIEELFRSGAMPIDVCLLQCSPPDAEGYMTVGPSVDASLTAAECARRVIVEINDQCPATCGDTKLHVSRVDSFVETSHALCEYPRAPVTELQRQIARHVAALIPDGATIQTGIGGIPEAVLGLLRDRRNLAIHSEMVPDGVIDLMEAGALDPSKKIVSGFVLGSRRLFDFIHRNPAFEFRRTAYCNDPSVIAAHDRMVAINSAIEVDLTGQVCSDSMGTQPYSGIGGQVDFLRGAARSKGGLPVLTLPSTACGGEVSRIVPMLKPGAGVVTSRGDVHYVVTEYGVAYLHGKTLRQRAEALIAIAHPKFQPALEEYAAGHHLLERGRYSSV